MVPSVLKRHHRPICQMMSLGCVAAGTPLQAGMHGFVTSMEMVLT